MPAHHADSPDDCMVRGGPVSVGAQDCHSREKGAHTGDISAKMLADLGARYVIVGHSERREDHNETSEQVREKALAAHNATLSAIICVGETISQRDAGWAEKIVLDQLAHSVPDGATASNTVIAYEPIWAIGTGRIPKPEDVAMMHQTIRDHLADRFALGDQMRILYGGSVKASNAHTLMAVPNVNGALVGGASLRPWISMEFLMPIAAIKGQFFPSVNFALVILGRLR